MNKRINLNSKKQTLRGPDGIKLELDAAEVYPNNPGMGTPALLTLPSGETGTFNCAYEIGEAGGKALTQDQSTWLEEIAEAVNQWLSNQVRVAAN
jgi:hypothetical protein